MTDKPDDGGNAVLGRLFATIESRKGMDPSTSYTAKLLADGRAKIAQKLGEEAIEAAIASIAGEKTELVRESADLLYHLLVLWAACGVAPAEVWAELEKREGRSGIAEKAGRDL
ncbi:MAG: phosphoribosyl-ATP diphosphatase [Alphaproteobacteria bacterium]|nr:phosphoribosyl-ATP diphosphatase [Alphaproteobacteria bacterium]